MSPMRPRSRSTLRAGACADESRPRSLWRSWGSVSRRDLLRREDRRYRPVAIVRFGLLNPARRPVLKTTELWPATGPRKIMSIVQRWIPVRTDDDPGLKVINDHRLHPRPERPIVAVAATAPGQVRGVRCRDTSNTEQKCTRKAAAHWICSSTTKQGQRNGLQCIRSLRDAASNRLVTLIQEPATSISPSRSAPRSAPATRSK